MGGWQPHPSLGMLGLVDGIFPLHRVRALAWSLHCHGRGRELRHCRQDPHGSALDGRFLVHLPDCLLVPDVRHRRQRGGGRHSNWLFHLRHHLQVWCWPRHLPDQCCEDKTRGGGRSCCQQNVRPCSSFLFCVRRVSLQHDCDNEIPCRGQGCIAPWPRGGTSFRRDLHPDLSRGRSPECRCSFLVPARLSCKACSPPVV